MRILCIADIHGDLEAAKNARCYAAENDMDTILILGDFPGHGVFHNTEMSRETVVKVLDVFSGLRVLAIPGNCDPQMIPDLFEKRGVNLHEKVKEVDGIRIAGFGGSNVTPFSTPFEMGEEEIYQRMEKLTAPLSGGGDRVILAVHCPPKDTNCDQTLAGTHAGSSSIRKIIEEVQPALVVCSHIHEAGGALDVIGRTNIANIGRLANGNVGIVKADGKIEIELKNMKK